MYKKYLTLFLTLVIIFLVDQYIKSFFVNGYEWHSKCISLTFTLNKGVAFSMFAFLKEYLKYIQLILISAIVIYLFINREIISNYSFAIGLLLGAGLSNLFDRFIHGGVVDYVYWHCWFDFAIFNFADVMIDLAVVILIYLGIKNDRKIS